MPRLKSFSEEDLRDCEMYHINQKASCRVWHTQAVISRAPACELDTKLTWRPVHCSSESQEPIARRLKYADTEHKSTN